MAAQAVNAMRRIGKTVSRKNSRVGADLYHMSLPDKSEWVANHELKMLMLDG